MTQERTAYKVFRPAASIAQPVVQARFQYAEMGGDWTRGYLIHADGTVGEELVYLAKPWLLRRSPFDGQTRDGIQYEYVTDIKRTAYLLPLTTEEQQSEIIVPAYIAGDEIAVVYTETGVTDPTGKAVMWLDCTTRMWMKAYGEQ